MSRLLHQNKPIVTNSLALAAFSIHIILNIADYSFYAWAHNIHAYADNFSRFMIDAFKPVVSAALIAPFVCLVRSTTIRGEFRNILFIAVSVSIVFSLLNLASTSDIRY